MRVRLAALSALSAAVTVLSMITAPSAGAADEEPERSTAAPSWTYSGDEPIPPGDIAARAIAESVSHAEAERRLRVDLAASVLQAQAQGRWPETFAGVWIDHEPFRVNVAFTDAADRNVAELGQTFPYPGDLRAVTATVSLDALTALQGVLGEERLLLRNGRRPAGAGRALAATRGGYDLDIDVAGNVVVLRAAAPSAELRAELRGRFGSRVAVAGGLGRPRACTIAACNFAMMGGLKLVFSPPTSPSYCSSAFTAYNTTYTATQYALSAGHCTVNSGNSYRSHGGYEYGRVTKYVFGDVDAERVSAQSTYFRQVSKFFVEEEYPRMVTSVTSYSAMVVGAYVGKTGARTGTTRGYITSKNVSPAYLTASNIVAADMCSADGDSGGAVWKANSGYGILSGGNYASCRDRNGVKRAPRWADEGPTWFGALTHVTSALNVTILTGVNLPPVAGYTHQCSLTQCFFNGGTSSDEDGGVAEWTWDFDDGQSATGNVSTHSHTYLAPGVYSVTLTVKDNNGATATTTTEVVVSA